MSLKNAMAIKAVFKIIAYSLFCIWLLSILVDGLFNDILANSVSEYSRSFYLFCVSKKDLLITIGYFIVIAIVSFIVIRNLNSNIVEVISAMDNILKKPEDDIKLSSDLAIIESKLNKLRIDLITSKTEVEGDKR